MEGRLAGGVRCGGKPYTGGQCIVGSACSPCHPPSQLQAIVSIAACMPGTRARCVEVVHTETWASVGAGVSPWGWELFSSSPGSPERFHCVTTGWPSRRALSLRHLCTGLGRQRTSLDRPRPLRSPSKCPAGGLLCPQGLLCPVSVPSCGTGGRAAAAPSGHGCCRAEGAVGSVSGEAVSGGF